MEAKQSVEDHKARVIQEFERYTGKRNVQISIEPIGAWRGVPRDAYQVTFRHEGYECNGRFFHEPGFDIMGFEPNAETPVWDLYGRPSQVFRGKTELLEYIESIAAGSRLSVD